MVFHVLNRANARLPLFETPGDYQAFEAVLEQAQRRTGLRLLAYTAMPNHWHLVVWPESDTQVSEFTGWLTLTHTQRWHVAHDTVGTGHLYQGRYKSFPVEEDEHFLTVCRYVERNALRAGLVQRAEEWRWSSLWRRTSGDHASRAVLSEWPVEPPDDWVDLVNEPLTEDELDALRSSAAKGCPYGSGDWRRATADELGLNATLRRRGRPRLRS